MYRLTVYQVVSTSDVNKDLTLKAKDRTKDLFYTHT